MTFLFALLFFTSHLVAGNHDFHVSRLTVNQVATEKRTKIVLQTFIDDMETAVTAPSNMAAFAKTQAKLPMAGSLDLLEKKQHPLADSLVAQYLRSTISLSAQGAKVPLPIRFIGMERAADPYAMFVYLSVASGEVNEFTLRSTFMNELYEDQQNVVIWQVEGEAEDYDLLTLQNQSCSFSR